MSKSTNKLLTTLGAMGLVAGVAAMPNEASAQWNSLGEFVDYAATSMRGDLKSKIDFVRAYPQSPAATRFVAELAQDLQAMSELERQAMLDEIAALGGIPSEVPGIEKTPFGAPNAMAALSKFTTSSTQKASAKSPNSIY